MFEQDYVMRMIRELIRGMLKMCFGIDTDSPALTLVKNEEKRQTTEELLKMTDDGRINEAEDRLFCVLEPGNGEDLKMALVFYAHVNEKTDAFLEAHGFSRAEIHTGLRDITEKAGVGGLMD